MSDATPPHIPKLIARNRSVRQGQFLYEDREWMRSRYEAGLSFHELAAEADCGLRTIARWFHLHGLESRPIGHKRPGHTRPKNPPRCACGKEKGYYAKGCVDCYDKRGAGNPNWQGYADVALLLRQHIGETWRPAVFERDGYRCLRCGDNRGGNLHAHHVEPVSTLLRRKRNEWLPDLSTAAGRIAFLARLKDAPEVMDLNNGLTLCDDCHRAVHRGKGTYTYAALKGRRSPTS